MSQAKALFDRGEFTECIVKCEAELKYATTAQEKFSLNILASKAAMQAGNYAQAIRFAEMAVKLDEKMPAYQALADAYRLAKDPKLGDVLSKQYLIASRNQARDRALEFAREAAKSYETAGNWPLAIERWRDALACCASLGMDSVECTVGLINAFEISNDVAQADQLIWRVCESKNDVTYAHRYLSRPAHVILESRRMPNVSREDVEGAWGELERRRARLEDLEWPEINFLLLACRIIFDETISPSSFIQNNDQETFMKVKEIVEKDSEHPAVKARAIFFVAKGMLHAGNSSESLRLIDEAENLEQTVYGQTVSKTVQETGTKQILIGSAPIQMRRFSGLEVLSLLCARTAVTHLVAARAAMLSFTPPYKNSLKLSGKHLRDATMWLDKSLVGDEKMRSLVREASLISEWLASLAKCSRGCGPSGVMPRPSAKDTASTISAIIEDLRRMRVSVSMLDELETLARDVATDHFVRQVASLAVIVCRAILVDANRSSQVVQRVCEKSFLDAQKSDLAMLWKTRLSFVVSSIDPTAMQFDGSFLVSIISREPDDYPLAYELLGKYFMGLSGQSFDSVPEEQPQPKQVRDPVKAVKFLQLAVKLDPLGLGAAIPLANAYHAAKIKEVEAAQLYQKIIDQVERELSSANPDVHVAGVASFAFTRLGQQQYHFEKYVHAATSFTRALSALGRPEKSLNIDAWIGLGECHARIGRLGAASQSLEKAISIVDPITQGDTLAACLIKLASVRRKMGQPISAGEALKRIESLELKCGDTLKSLAQVELAETLLEEGRFWYARGALTAAFDCYHKSQTLFDLHKSDSNAISVVAAIKGLGDVLSEQGDYVNAQREYLRAIHMEPWQSLARFDAARAYKLGKNYGTLAQKLSDGALRLDPADPISWSLASLVCEQNDVLVRQHALVRSLQLAPALSALPWMNLGWTFAQGGKANLARRAFTQAQTVDAGSGSAWIGLASVPSDSSRKSDVIPALECAVDAIGYIPDKNGARAMSLLGKKLLGQLGICIDETRRFHLGMELLDLTVKLIQMDSLLLIKNMAENRLMCALALIALERPEQAKIWFEQSVSCFMTAQDVVSADRVRINLAMIMEDPLKALEDVLECGDRSPVLAESFEYWSTMADLATRAGAQERAAEGFERAIKTLLNTVDTSRKNVVACQLYTKWARSMIDQGQDVFALALARDACDYANKLDEGRLHHLCSIAVLSESIAEYINTNFVRFPSLDIAPEDWELRLSVMRVTLAKSTDIYAEARFCPWNASSWIRAASQPVDSRGRVSAAAAALRLFDLQPPRDCRKLVKVSAALPANFTVEPVLAKKIVEDDWMERANKSYWLSRTRTKVRHMCPWEK